MLVKISEGGRDLESDLRALSELDPEATLSVPRQEPTIASFDLLDDRPGKIPFAGLGQQGVLFLLRLDESLESAISWVIHAGLGSLVEDIVDGWTLNGTDELRGLCGNVFGRVFLEKQPGLEPLDVIFGFDDTTLCRWQELDRDSKAQELRRKFLPLTRMEVHPGTVLAAHHKNKEGPDEVKESRAGPAKMKAD
jgi:hypothetical protein